MLGWVEMAPIFVISLCDIFFELLEPHGAKGVTFLWETSALQAETVCQETIAKHDILL
jgi:hypothetical protein